MQYVMGIDHGGTSSKAAIFDQKGNEIASASGKTQMFTPGSGQTERDMETLYQVNCAVIRKTIEKAGVDPKDIVGVSFSGHGKGLYLWGNDERPARPGIVSTDSRAVSYIEQWNVDGTADKAFEKTRQSILACQPVALLSWIRDNEPGVLENTKWIFGVKDYIRYRMTGEAFAEITDISGSSMVNLNTFSYDRDLMALYGLEDLMDKLPPLKYSADLCGSVTDDCAAQSGLVPGTPVAAGLFDIDACAISMDIVDEDHLAVIAGTWSINEYIAKSPVLDRSVKMNSLYCLPGYYLVEECSPTSASNQEWFVGEFLQELAQSKGKHPYEVSNEMAASVDVNATLPVYLPYLFGGCDDARARASFIGIDGGHTRAHLMRAVYEGVVFGHKLHINRLMRHREHTTAIRMAGGVVNSPMWVQMFADVLGQRIETIKASELGCLGAAMAAAVAAGLYPDLKTAASDMVQIGRIYTPNPDVFQAYEKKFKRWADIENAMRGCWAML